MLTTLIILLLVSNAITLRVEYSIYFSGIVVVGLLYIINYFYFYIFYINNIISGIIKNKTLISLYTKQVLLSLVPYSLKWIFVEPLRPYGLSPNKSSGFVLLKYSLTYHDMPGFNLKLPIDIFSYCNIDKSVLKNSMETFADTHHIWELESSYISMWFALLIIYISFSIIVIPLLLISFMDPNIDPRLTQETSTIQTEEVTARQKSEEPVNEKKIIDIRFTIERAQQANGKFLAEFFIFPYQNPTGNPNIIDPLKKTSKAERSSRVINGVTYQGLVFRRRIDGAENWQFIIDIKEKRRYYEWLTREYRVMSKGLPLYYNGQTIIVNQHYTS